MRAIKIFFSSGAAYTALVTPAHADPISLIATAIHGFLLSSTAIAATATGVIATVAANVIVGGALLGLSMLGQRNPGRVNPSDAKSTFEGGQSSVIEGLGRVRVGGMKAFGNTDGSTRWRVVARLQGPIDAVEEYFVGGRVVTVEDNGNVSSPPWSKKGGSWMKIEDKVGTGSDTAWPALVSAFPTLWSTNHRLRGIAQSLVTFFNPGLTEAKYLTLYQSGVPDTEEIVRASKIYDPRVPATQWSDNGILCAAHVLRRDPAFTFDMFDWTLIGQEATRADALVAKKGGTEKRSRCWGLWAWEGARKDTMEDILRSIGAEIRMTSEGKIWFQLIDDTPASEFDVKQTDMVSFDWVCGPEAVERPNICRVKYYSPERNYEIADIDMTGIAWARIDDEVTKYGPKYYDVELPFCPSASQAQRIARRLFRLARAESGVAVTNMVGLAIWGLYYGTVETPTLGDIDRVRFLPPRSDEDRGTVEVPFAVWPSLPAWIPATDEANAPDPIPELAYQSDLPQPDAPYGVLIITYPDSSKETRILYTLPAVTYDTIECTYRTFTGGLPDTWNSTTERPTFAFFAGDLTGQTYDARVRIFEEDDGSYYSDIFHASTVSVNNTPCGAPNLLSGGTTVIGGGTLVLDVVISVDEARAASILFERRTSGGSYVTVSQINARPGQNYSYYDSSPLGTTWRFRTVTSDGTLGTALILS